MKSLFLERILLNIIIIFGFILFPWYVYFSIIILGIIIFNNFYEGYFWTMLLDISFGPEKVIPIKSFDHNTLSIYFIYTFIFAILFFIINFVKTKVLYRTI